MRDPGSPPEYSREKTLPSRRELRLPLRLIAPGIQFTYGVADATSRSSPDGETNGHPRQRTPRRRSGPLAQSAARGMAGYSRHASHVDADRGQDSPGPRAKAEPLVARSPVRELARVDHDTNSLRPPLIRSGVRFHRSSPHREDERRSDPRSPASTAGRRRFLSG